MTRICLLPAVGIAVVLTQSAVSAEIKTPAVGDPQLELTLVAAESDVVTPIGIAVDRSGRLFVVEFHTQFPQTNYPSPKFDRIILFSDSVGDGKPDRNSVFAEGLHHTILLERR